LSRRPPWQQQLTRRCKQGARSIGMGGGVSKPSAAGAMATGQELKEIVDRLNAEPFNMQLSLVTFDEKQPFELLEVLHAIFVFLDPKRHEGVDLREEESATMYARMGEFLHILGFKANFDAEFQQGLVCGDKKVIYPIVSWLVQNLDALKKRAYLANYCVTLDVPEEILQDEQVFELFNEYKTLQSHFKAVHSHLEQLRTSSVSPADLKREIQQLDAEKDHLVQKISQFKQKTANQAGFQVLLNATSMLRKEQEEEARLREKIVEQRIQLDQTQAFFLDSSRALCQVRDAQKQRNCSAETMLKLLREEVAKNRTSVQRFQRETEEKMRRVQELEQALSEPSITQMHITQNDMQIEQFKTEIESLKSQVTAQSDTDGKLTIYRQQAALVSKKKEIALRDLQQLEDERDRLSNELMKKEREYEQFKGHKFLPRDEFKQYAATLRDKTAKFKRLKAELEEVKLEVKVLTSTEALIASRAKDHNVQVEELERQKGIHGYDVMEDKLEDVSEKKTAVDEEKKSTALEISRVVEEIQNQIRHKKDKLAPQIKVLRKVRQEFQNVETEYLQKKGVYESMKLQMDQQIGRIKQEVEALEKEKEGYEARFFEHSILMTAAKANLQRAHREKQCQAGTQTFSPQFPEFKTLKAYYEAEIAKLSSQQTEMRKQKKQVDATHTQSLQQREMFQNVLRLMECKVKTVYSEMQSMDKSAEQFRAALDHSVAGVNRLVVE